MLPFLTQYKFCNFASVWDLLVEHFGKVLQLGCLWLCTGVTRDLQWNCANFTMKLLHTNCYKKTCFCIGNAFIVRYFFLSESKVFWQYFVLSVQHAMLQPCKDMMVIFSRRLPVRVWEQFLILELRLYTMQMAIAPISQSWPQLKFPLAILQKYHAQEDTFISWSGESTLIYAWYDSEKENRQN